MQQRIRYVFTELQTHIGNGARSKAHTAVLQPADTDQKSALAKTHFALLWRRAVQHNPFIQAFMLNFGGIGELDACCQAAGNSSCSCSWQLAGTGCLAAGILIYQVYNTFDSTMEQSNCQHNSCPVLACQSAVQSYQLTLAASH